MVVRAWCGFFRSLQGLADSIGNSNIFREFFHVFFEFALKFSTEICSPNRLFLPKSGFSEFVVSSGQFCCTICNWGKEFVPPLWRQHFFRIDSSRINFRCVHFSNSSMSATRISPFQIPPAINAYLRCIPGKTSLPNWWTLDWSLAEIG